MEIQITYVIDFLYMPNIISTFGRTPFTRLEMSYLSVFKTLRNVDPLLQSIFLMEGLKSCNISSMTA